jgi:hypothetical protein
MDQSGGKVFFNRLPRNVPVALGLHGALTQLGRQRARAGNEFIGSRDIAGLCGRPQFGEGHDVSSTMINAAAALLYARTAQADAAARILPQLLGRVQRAKRTRNGPEVGSRRWKSTRQFPCSRGRLTGQADRCRHPKIGFGSGPAISEASYWLVRVKSGPLLRCGILLWLRNVSGQTLAVSGSSFLAFLMSA